MELVLIILLQKSPVSIKQVSFSRKLALPIALGGKQTRKHISIICFRGKFRLSKWACFFCCSLSNYPISSLLISCIGGFKTKFGKLNELKQQSFVIIKAIHTLCELCKIHIHRGQERRENTVRKRL